MTTTPLHYDYNCCRPVVLVQPNDPGGCNGLFVQMPPAVCDERYGSLWMGRVDQTTSDANSCPNYVANRNAGIANPVECDPQIELSLIWHQFYDPMGNEHWGRYETFVAPVGFGYGGGPSPHLDLDIDSDNNNAFDPPDRNGLEDWLEDIWTKPGKKIDVNNDDSDGDGIPDFADGFNWGSDPADDASPDDRFVPLVLELPESVDLSIARLNLTYSAADPAAVTFDAISSTWHPGYGGHLRIWKTDGSQPRNKNSAKATGNPGDYVEPGIYDDLSALGLSGGNRLVTLYVEGILPSYSRGDQRITVALDPDGNGTEGWKLNDAVRVSVLTFRLDIDSDNNNGFDLPGRDQVERAVKTKQLEDLPDEERVHYPGKILMVNDGDVDGDGVPDFADNLDLFEADGVQLQGDDWPECPRLIPIVLQLGTPSTYATMKVRFTYSASNPAEIQKIADGEGGYIYTPSAEGKLRVWTKNGASKRKVAAINANGDYVVPGINFSAADLGFNDFTDTVTLFVEAVDVSSDVADLEIKVEAGWEPPGGGVIEYALTDFVRVTALNLALMKVDENNNVTKVVNDNHSFPWRRL